MGAHATCNGAPILTNSRPLNPRGRLGGAAPESWRRFQSVANPSLGANPRSAGKMQGNRPNTGSRSSQMVDFRLDPGFSAVISLSLITGNLCATSRVFWPGITPTRGVRADSSSHLETATVVGTQGVTDLSSAGGQLPHRISARALSCLSNPTASGRWTRHSATSLKLSVQSR
jgi:hypothetical protein